ncbi:hypothetical protein KA016_02610 [Candidatus Saccharibacteria bacterium]|nr:hypothetical protein [Candidatus Saccharibacteria bacterium]
MMRHLKLFLITLFVATMCFGFASQPSASAYQVKCPDTEVNVPDDPQNPGGDSHSCCPRYVNDKTPMNCLTAKYINPTVRLLSFVVGITVVIAIILGGIRYSGSAGDPQKAEAGKKMITKAIYALVGYIFLFSVLQFLSPGGLNGKPVDGPANAKSCAHSFLGLKPWFAYLPEKGTDSTGAEINMFDENCQVVGFHLLPDGSATGSNKSHLPAVLLVIADDLLRLAGLVAVAFVIVGGAKYITSQGEPDRAKQARESIINALIGLAIAIVAAGVVSFIGNKLTGS